MVKITWITYATIDEELTLRLAEMTAILTLLGEPKYGKQGLLGSSTADIVEGQ